MSEFAQLHPQAVHFAIALLFAGVGFRVLSLFGRPKFADGAALTLLLVGTVAMLVAFESGHDAHGPIERIPGVRAAVVEHETAAEYVHDIFVGVVILELIALGMLLNAKTAAYQRYVRIASALVGLFGLTTLYRTADLGGQLVYNYAGGPGLRSGEPADIQRLLIAGLYTQSLEDRKAGRKEDAARLIEEMARRAPTDTTVHFLRVESLLRDRENPTAALALVDSLTFAPDDARNGSRRAGLRADIFLALQQPDSAKAALDAAIAAFPQNARLKARRDSMP